MAAAMDEWLAPTRLIDSDHPLVAAAAARLTAGARGDADKALRLYSFMRDGIKFGMPSKFDMVKASEVLQLGYGFCNPKATLFVALLRAAGIPARMHMVGINMAINSGLGMPDSVYGDHAFTEVFLGGRWVALDSYVVDAPLHAAAKAKLAAAGWAQGFGVHARGVNEWDGAGDSFVQYVWAPVADAPRGPGDVARAAGALSYPEPNGPTTRDSPQSGADFGVVRDIEDFASRVTNSPFAMLRTAAFRLPLVIISALINRKIAAARRSQ